MYFSILIYDEPNSGALRDEHRQAHLDYLKGFDDQTLFAGPFTTDDNSVDLGSLRLIEFPDRAAAEHHIANEPFITGGVQKRWRLHRWNRSVSNTWRDCPRKDGNIQMLFHGLDHPGAQAIRAEHHLAHAAYLKEHANTVMVRGPLLNDEGAEKVGSVLLLDVPDLDAGRAFMANEPFNKAGLYKDPMLQRWRFGRIFDRNKV
ncbi:MAG: hypothetical protein HOM25_01905 [Rhodospirillaceae bacterium]|jgi:hypothetical protein|nr:hypothetical protein [Rhodospirillaceae bacterium]MBT5666451.1 hypothetical protein [Rhodospirillaceae bacterium]MBT5809638.1 hypothetical protein [Rhodospirillaceae bacterium]